MKSEVNQYKVLLISGLAEFGERYSFYIIQSLLIFFLIDKLEIPQSQSASLVGTVIGLVFISSIIGGYIGDKVIGRYQSAMIGTIFMLCGSLFLSISNTQNLLFLSLTLISISTGLIKPNISSFIGKYYDMSQLNSEHRDFGFTIFYTVITCGGFAALLISSSLKNIYGYAVPFYSISLISGLALSILVIGFFKLNFYIDKIQYNLSTIVKSFLILFIYTGIVFIIFKNAIIGNLVNILVFCLVCLILIKSSQKLYWHNVRVATLIFILSIFYWTLYFQKYTSFLLLIDKAVNHQVLTFYITNSQFLSVETFGVIIFGPIIGRIWRLMGRSSLRITDIDKFNISFILIGIAFLLLYLGLLLSKADSQIPAAIVILSFIILAISGLCIATIGMACITKIAPPGFASLYMGIWFVTVGIGGKISGIIASHIVLTNLYSAKVNMKHALILFMCLSLVGIIICIFSRKCSLIKK